MKEGDIIEGPYWPERLKIIKLEDHGDDIEIQGEPLESGKVERILLPKKEIKSKIKVFDTTIDFSSDSLEVFLALEAIRFKNASLFDPFLAVNVARVDPLPFQIEAVYGYILKPPKIRFLLADDPGAGKTIMSGILIKELKLRRPIHRILIVVPSHLRDQWQGELKEKFNEKFVIIGGRDLFKSNLGQNPWQKENLVITSIDFVKQEDILSSLDGVEWDLVIVDEAHKLAAYKYDDKTKKTRYKVGEVLSKNSRNLLFLTATPHKGDENNFTLIIGPFKTWVFYKL